MLDYPGFPAIDYEYQINIQPNQDGSSTVRVQGNHDGFPAHSVQITDMENGTIYRPSSYVPESKKNINELYPIPGSEIEVQYETKKN